ncbi:M48 family metallopeptidase [Polynucleobacter sp. AP-Melu-500A-A1]|uniref:M48 family metallopeptidase n=1 Tax=Polynucleobacter sp. AP-Melu-500A-A1 TaxID=2576929 RepID=UPI001C0DA892|nr:M48 family metallopeptidase [Polynucleobacter sp. AP-Melu-500A-A1]MBU3630106.1 M48 family metallopeptidase [Polynucleobacter sp. AP-Melu-500A-A1]
MKPRSLLLPLFASIFCLFLSQNALSSSLTISIPNGQWWEEVRQGNSNLATKLGLQAPAQALKTLAQVRKNMLSYAKTTFTVGLIPSNEVNAYARVESGYTLIIFTSGFLLRFGNDPDVLATTLGHELAHHVLGHTNHHLGEPEKPVYMLTGNSMGANSALTIERQKSVKDIQHNERQADLVGMEWAVKAGYSACGSYRLAEGLAEIQSNSTSNLYLSTHPSNLERMETAKQFGRNNYQATSCMASNDKVPVPETATELPTLASEPLVSSNSNQLSHSEAQDYMGWM